MLKNSLAICFYTGTDLNGSAHSSEQLLAAAVSGSSPAVSSAGFEDDRRGTPSPRPFGGRSVHEH